MGPLVSYEENEAFVNMAPGTIFIKLWHEIDKLERYITQWDKGFQV